MRALKFLTLFFLIYNPVKAQDNDDTEEVHRSIIVCSYCTCSEIPDVDGTHLVLNIQCSELDRTENLADLDKIEWPENPNGLKIAAAFEGLGLTTLGKLPPNSQVETLRFSNNAINTYWPDPLSDVPSLKKLSFTQNELTEITPDLFTKAEGLEDVDLSFNKIAELNPLDFKYLHHVKRLNLQSNLLRKIPVEALQPMTMLEDLDLSKNGIHDLLLRRTESGTLRGIRRLNLNGNRIRSIVKDSFPEDNNIELLDLSNNIIEVIEEDALLSCTSLRELNLAQNNITFTFALPSTLQIAILKINTLYHWPKFPSGITFVDLSYNRLSALYDEDNVEFDNLEILSIGGNQIKDFYIEKKLPKLFSLDLSYNLLTDVPKSLSTQTFPRLEELRLDGNPIESIYFKNIIALKNLYMNDLSKLHVVEDKAFSNVIGRVGDESFFEQGCFSLFLSNCASLRSIEEGAFDATTLCMLDISKNNLTSLSRTLLDWKSLPEGANLQFNPWHCSCDLQWLLDDLLPQMYRANSRLLAELRCGSPRAYEGLRLVHWYNWTEQAMCTDDLSMRSGPYGTYMVEQSTEGLSKVTSLTLILGGCIIVALLIAIALVVYLVRTRRRHRIRQAALNRKRQSAADAKNSNGAQKEQFSALNKA
ncbi:leucine-rich repeat-containing G-protein coupled receptor 5-like [Maniola jurtina]|uniref:leucine-rich repeat-containing G-protein coupled receptor 5-like n=1 Tax=Maniola jurtina TaxID=191418 RepID=UPI001E689275|nr:leucine-rich repeat-containing G-protein coupled receptor 5-like [Maniola jurtina]XP_045771780.1 leucine-rich repeat-containing G-protein coupled receptor 5-like [Maniola jurtina]